jgi:polyhydroxyalkanoate synthase subunit PhaC
VELRGAVADTDLDWRDRYRAEFLVELLTASMSPTNTLVGNPAVLKRAWETDGMSVTRGAGHLVRHLIEDRGPPSTVDQGNAVVESQPEVADSLVVGVELDDGGTTCGCSWSLRISRRAPRYPRP